jgi:hypothetical protein
VPVGVERAVGMVVDQHIALRFQLSKEDGLPLLVSIGGIQGVQPADRLAAREGIT